jgi:hypothetical protein
VDLYDVVAGRYRARLSKAQITGLLQAGQLTPNDSCKPLEAKQWRTINDLLSHETPRSLYQPTDLHSPRTRVVGLTVAASVLIVAAGLLTGYFVFRETPGPKNTVLAKDAVNPPMPVSYTVENPYLSSPKKARLEQERQEAARKAREQAQLARIAQDRAEAEQKERELHKPAVKTAHVPADAGAKRRTAKAPSAPKP